MFIQTQNTPNPATLKFLPGQDVAPSIFEFKSKEDLGNSPLAQRLFSIVGVKAVMFGRDFVSVTKTDEMEWAMLKPMVLAALMEHLSMGLPVILNAELSDEKSGEGDSEIVVQIKELIETRVRPAVMMDGGDIVFDSFDEGVVYLRMRGACAGCPSSTMTLKSGIENMLRHYVPEVTEVRQVADY